MDTREGQMVSSADNRSAQELEKGNDWTGLQDKQD